METSVLGPSRSDLGSNQVIFDNKNDNNCVDNYRDCDDCVIKIKMFYLINPLYLYHLPHTYHHGHHHNLHQHHDHRDHQDQRPGVPVG